MRRLASAVVLIVLAAGCAGDETTTGASVTTSTTVVADPAPTTSTSTTAAPSTTSTSTTTSTPATTTTEASRCVRVTDFDEPDWFIVNDGVMGGRSDARGGVADGVLAWEGTIVTQGGGFSSIRGPVDGELAGASELVLRIRTDGRAFELLADDAGSTRVTHYNPIDATGGDWEEVVVPLTGMEARIFGSLVDADAFQPDRANQIGVILADGMDGDFAFEIDWIDACP
ncbi:MAG: CIA30 family protein [Actinomycetota bacterium]